MALTIRVRPQGITFGAAISGNITDTGGNATVNSASHGLTTGDIVYVDSTYSPYNGFWQAVVTSLSSFWLTDWKIVVPYMKDDNVSFYKGQTKHTFNAVHLPIVYLIANDLFPTNSVDTARTVNTFTNDQGYTKLTLSGNLKASGDTKALEFVKLTVNSVSGIYQILQVFSNSQFTIDLEYDGGDVFGTCQNYYSNYHAKIKVYGGLTGTEEDYNPTELISELEVFPDSTNNCIVNINEILKSKMNLIKNDPEVIVNNKDLDAFITFYIEYAESYDQSSDGYTLGTYTSSYTSDAATLCYAINAKLPFKNVYGGFMSEYLGNARKFLTTMTAPSLFPGNYFDISFLYEDIPSFLLRRQKYLNGVLQGTSYDNITDYDEGVYRVAVSQDTTEDRIDLTLVANNVAFVTETVNVSGSSGTSSQTNTKNWYLKADQPVTDLTYTYNATVAGPADVGDTAIVRVTYIYDDGTSENVINVTQSTAGTTAASNQAFPTPTKNVVQVQIYAFFNAVATTANNVSALTTLTYVGGAGYVTISETLTIDVDEDCTNQDIYLTWKNYLGGHDYWLFTAEKEYGVDIIETTESTKNIFPEWPKSYGEFSDTIDFETSRRSKNTILVRSQNLTLAQVTGLKYIKTSPLVQVMESSSNRRTVIVDPNSFVVYNETDKIYGIQFTIRYTDDIPSQSL